MIATILTVNMLFSSAILAGGTTRHFPSDYYTASVHQQLENQVLMRWPGPETLIEMWNQGDLNSPKRVTLLLGASAFHDPRLLPVYLEALSSPDARIRQAAADGYRALTADRTPNVSSGITLRERRALIGEITVTMQTLQVHTLPEMWAAALLDHEGTTFPGYTGMIPQRRPADCMHAIAALADVYDLPLVVTTYQLSNEISTRIGLLRIIEGLTLQSFLDLPQGSGARWGPRDYHDALDALDGWLSYWQTKKCNLDPKSVLQRSFASMGVPALDPFAQSSCGTWLAVLDRGDPKFWGLASRRLYNCGAPPAMIDMLQPETDEAKAKRTRLLGWHGMQ